MVLADITQIDANSAGVVGLLIVTVGGLLTTILQNRRIHQATRSPNGETSGEMIQKILRIANRLDADLEDDRRELFELARLLAQHLADGHGPREENGGRLAPRRSPQDRPGRPQGR